MFAIVFSLLVLFALISEKKAANDASTPVIEEGPSPLNVSVNAKASFSCVVSNADLVLWFVNDSSIDNLNDFIDTQFTTKIGNASSLRYTMSFVMDRAFETQLNNTGFKCIGVAYGPPYLFNESTEAILRVQGVLDSPSNISATITTDIVSITWQPPYTLKGIVIYDYEVNVTVYNGSGTIRQKENSTDMENITFSLVDQNVCTVYNSSVQARSDAGLGHFGTVEVISEYEVPRKLNSSQIGVEVSFTENEIMLQYTVEQDNCAGRRAESVNATFEYATNVTSTGIIPARANDNGQIILEMSIPKSCKEDTVVTIITLINREGSTDSEPKLTNITSTNDFKYTGPGSVVSFECVFTDFSDANGCHVVFKCVNDPLVEPYTYNLTVRENSNASEPGNISCAFSSCTTYDVYVYDLTKNGSIGIQALLKSNLSFCLPPNSPTISPSSSMTPWPEPNSSLRTWVIILSVMVPFAIITFVALLICLVIGCYCCCKRKEGKELKEYKEQGEDEKFLKAS